jgi:hypothetical protein
MGGEAGHQPVGAQDIEDFRRRSLVVYRSDLAGKSPDLQVRPQLLLLRAGTRIQGRPVHSTEEQAQCQVLMVAVARMLAAWLLGV